MTAPDRAGGGAMTIHVGDCREVMATMDADSVDAVVCDPPYDLTGASRNGSPRQNDPTKPYGRHNLQPSGGFMGKAWDGTGVAFDPATWREAFRVLKPGAHLLAFGGTRTIHRMICAIEDAGFEIRDQIVWMYGSGFPKSLDVGKAMDKRGGRPSLATEIGLALKQARQARGMSASECDRLFCGGTTNWSWFEGRPTGQRAPTMETFAAIAEAWPEVARLAEMVAEAEREVVGKSAHKSGIGNGVEGHYTVGGTKAEHYDITAPATELARQWDGWGTALKPAHEPVVVARKPLISTVAANVARYGTGALNIDASRIGTADTYHYERRGGSPIHGGGQDVNAPAASNPLGRWPSNLILTHSPLCVEGVCHQSCPVRVLDEQSGESKSPRTYSRTTKGVNASVYGANMGEPAGKESLNYGDTGGASRFFLNTSWQPGELDEAARLKYSPKASRRERNAGLDGMPERRSGTGALRSEQGGEYLEFVHPVPDGVGEWLRQHRISAGLSVRDVASHFPSRTGGLTGCVTNWECEYNRPTPDQWRTLRRVIGFDGRYDDVMTAQQTVPHAERTEPVATKQNHHPTIKPVALMRYLVRLVTPPNGTVLDPFAGSGSTGIAAHLEGFRFVGIEQDAEYAAIAERRIAHVEVHGERWLDAAKANTAKRDSGVYAGGRGRRALPRCPMHDGTLPSGRNAYTCGCRLVYDDYTPRDEPRPTVPPADTPRLSDLPLFALVAD